MACRQAKRVFWKTCKLPAKRYIPLRIEEDIGKERVKLDELQAEVRKLELQTSHTQRLVDEPGSDDEMDDEPEEGPDIMDVDIDSTSNLSLGELQ